MMQDAEKGRGREGLCSSKNSLKYALFRSIKHLCEIATVGFFRPGSSSVCHIFRTVKPKNFKVDMRMEDATPHQRQAPWPPRLKVKVTWYVSPVLAILQNLHLVLWQSTKTPVWPTVAVTSKAKFKVISWHRLYTSHLCLFLIRETKCCTCVIRGGRKHTV